MAEGNETSDVWGRTADIDEVALSVMAERLESRAKHPFFRRVIAEYIGDLELDRISSALEIGCGTGVVSRALAVTSGFRGTITATDLSPHLIDAGRRYAEMEGVEGRITFEVSSAAALRAKGSTYDLIIAHTLFSHAANPVAILAECGRVLRSRGQLVIFDRDFASSALSLEKEIAATIDIRDIARAFAAQPSIIRQFPKLLTDIGFAIESHRSYVIADVGHVEFFSEQLTTWRRLNAARGFVAVHDRKLDVHEDEIWPIFCHRRNCLLAVFRFSDLVIAARQQIAHDLPIIFLVLDHQNSLAHMRPACSLTVTGSEREL
jgi:ubiquinone/menaquinone biosynthesis C-methylase UbiE